MPSAGSLHIGGGAANTHAIPHGDGTDGDGTMVGLHVPDAVLLPGPATRLSRGISFRVDAACYMRISASRTLFSISLCGSTVALLMRRASLTTTSSPKTEDTT